MERIRLTLIRTLPRMRLFIDTISPSIKLFIHHIDYAIDRIKAIIKLNAKITSQSIERAFLSVGIRFPIGMKHQDYANTSMLARMKMRTRANHADLDSSNASLVVGQLSKMHHTDIDNSRMRTMVVRPVLLGDIANMTLGEISNKTLGELTFDSVI